MDQSFWKARWEQGRIGFHEGKPNELLVNHVTKLGPAGRVLVPLCGKSEDMAFIAAQGHAVIGIELVEAATEAFFAEHDLTPEVRRRGAFTARSAAGITLLQGDFFSATRADVGAITAFYDRAAIIALPLEMRARYAAHLHALIGPGVPGLVITLEYPDEAMEGPPFPVREAELRGYYKDVQLLAQREASGNPRLPAGTTMTERLYAVLGNKG